MITATTSIHSINTHMKGEKCCRCGSRCCWLVGQIPLLHMSEPFSTHTHHTHTSTFALTYLAVAAVEGSVRSRMANVRTHIRTLARSNARTARRHTRSATQQSMFKHIFKIIWAMYAGGIGRLYHFALWSVYFHNIQRRYVFFLGVPITESSVNSEIFYIAYMEM